MKKAFTLVELIVVITILAILGAIAFISLQGYSQEARDTKRISDTRTLLNKINIETTKGAKLSELITTNKPINKLTINGEHPVDGYQGIVNFKNLKENGENFKDPKNKNQDYPIAYSIGGSGTGAYKFMQMATISEKDNQNKLVGNYFKLNETTDSPSLFTYEDKDGTNINTDYITEEAGNELVYVPQGGSDNGGGTPITPTNKTIADCTTAGEIIRDTGVYFENTAANGGQTCDTDDIIVCAGTGTGFQIAACNAGANVAGTHAGCTNPGGVVFNIDNLDCDPSRVGYHYQWMGNSTGGQTATGYAINDTSITSLNTAKNKGWIIGITGVATDMWTNNTQCGTGYHLPTGGTNGEWKKLITAWGGGTNGSQLRDDLLLPMAGYRYYNNVNLGSQGILSSYWSSNANGTSFAYSLNFDLSNVYPENNGSRTHGISIRCFKNLD